VLLEDKVAIDVGSIALASALPENVDALCPPERVG
jgi:hypothetical protein